MSVKKSVDKGIKYKGKSHKVKELIKKLDLKSDIDIKPGKGWFENCMVELDNSENRTKKD